MHSRSPSRTPHFHAQMMRTSHPGEIISVSLALSESRWNPRLCGSFRYILVRQPLSSRLSSWGTAWTLSRERKADGLSSSLTFLDKHFGKVEFMFLFFGAPSYYKTYLVHLILSPLHPLAMKNMEEVLNRSSISAAESEMLRVHTIWFRQRLLRTHCGVLWIFVKKVTRRSVFPEEDKVNCTRRCQAANSIFINYL